MLLLHSGVACGAGAPARAPPAPGCPPPPRAGDGAEAGAAFWFHVGALVFGAMPPHFAGWERAAVLSRQSELLS